MVSEVRGYLLRKIQKTKEREIGRFALKKHGDTRSKAGLVTKNFFDLAAEFLK
jgi:hypothetical protein